MEEWIKSHPGQSLIRETQNNQMVVAFSLGSQSSSTVFSIEDWITAQPGAKEGAKRMLQEFTRTKRALDAVKENDLLAHTMKAFGMTGYPLPFESYVMNLARFVASCMCVASVEHGLDELEFFPTQTGIHVLEHGFWWFTGYKLPNRESSRPINRRGSRRTRVRQLRTMSHATVTHEDALEESMEEILRLLLTRALERVRVTLNLRVDEFVISWRE